MPDAATPDYDRLAETALAGGLLSRDDAKAVLAAPDADVLALSHAAFRVRRAHFGTRVQLYYLKNAKSGLCPEDCRYCSQGRDSAADIDRYPMLSADRLLAGAADAAAAGARTYCIVASGRGPSNREVKHVADVAARIKAEHGLHICACLGLLKEGQAETLKAGGVDRINHNLNTGRGNHDAVVTTHTYDDRLATLKKAREAGLELCSGLIVGMGESADDLVDAALELRELRAESVPVNFLHAIDGTHFEKRRELDPRYCLKVLAMYRFLLPTAELRVAGGREVNLRSLQPLALYAANSLFVSDYLTTAGRPASEDHRMIEDLGFEVVVSGVESDAAGDAGFAGAGEPGGSSPRTASANLAAAPAEPAARTPAAACGV